MSVTMTITTSRTAVVVDWLVHPRLDVLRMFVRILELSGLFFIALGEKPVGGIHVFGNPRSVAKIWVQHHGGDDLAPGLGDLLGDVVGVPIADETDGVPHHVHHHFGDASFLATVPLGLLAKRTAQEQGGDK